LERNQEKRLGFKKGAAEIKEHPFFAEIDWNKVLHKQITPPEPYLAAYAKNIIESAPYQAA